MSSSRDCWRLFGRVRWFASRRHLLPDLVFRLVKGSTEIEPVRPVTTFTAERRNGRELVGDSIIAFHRKIHEAAGAKGRQILAPIHLHGNIQPGHS